jgi:hypothetical protein
MSKPTRKPPATRKPITDLDMVQMDCGVTRDVIKGRVEPPGGLSRVEYALCSLSYAIENLARLVSSSSSREGK